MQISRHQITIEEVAEQFNQWRQGKKGQFDPIPDNLRILVKQLTSCYSRNQIARSLKLSSATIKSFLQDNNNSSQTIDFIPLQVSSSAKVKQTQTDTNYKGQVICQITKPSGSKLTIHTTDPKAIIQAFLCSN